MEDKIKIESDGEEVWITNKSKIQMYAGDPGTWVWATVKMDKNELKFHLRELIKVWKAMR